MDLKNQRESTNYQDDTKWHPGTSQFLNRILTHVIGHAPGYEPFKPAKQVNSIQTTENLNNELEVIRWAIDHPQALDENDRKNGLGDYSYQRQ